MPSRPSLIGLDEPQYREIRRRFDGPLMAYETLPRIIVRDGELLVEDLSGFGYCPVSRVVYHGILEDDHDLIAGGSSRK